MLIIQFTQTNMRVSYDLPIEVDNLLLRPLSNRRQYTWSGLRRCWIAMNFSTKVYCPKSLSLASYEPPAAEIAVAQLDLLRVFKHNQSNWATHTRVRLKVNHPTGPLPCISPNAVLSPGCKSFHIPREDLKGAPKNRLTHIREALLGATSNLLF